MRRTAFQDLHQPCRDVTGAPRPSPPPPTHHARVASLYSSKLQDGLEAAGLLRAHRHAAIDAHGRFVVVCLVVGGSSVQHHCSPNSITHSTTAGGGLVHQAIRGLVDGQHCGVSTGGMEDSPRASCHGSRVGLPSGVSGAVRHEWPRGWPCAAAELSLELGPPKRRYCPWADGPQLQPAHAVPLPREAE